MNYLKKLTIVFFVCFLFSNLNSQISEGGLPYSFKNNLVITLNPHVIAEPSSNELQIASINDRNAYIVGILKNTSISLTKNGK